MPESAAGWTAAGYSPKSFFFVNLFPSGAKFGPGSGKSHPMHFLPRPRVGLKSDSFCIMNFMSNSPVYPSVQKEILFQREFLPPWTSRQKLHWPVFFLSPTPFSYCFPPISHQNQKILKIGFFSPDGILYTIFPSNFSHLIYFSL